MKLTVLNSNSKGNCYILQNEHEALVIECGVKFSEVKKALDFNISKVVAVLVSHEHGDHAKAINDALNACLSVYSSQGTIDAIKNKGLIKGSRFPVATRRKEIIKRGNFKIMPFDVQHDCAEPFGFLIYHPETGYILFATDTYYLKYIFPNLSHILIECNYSKEILQENYREGKTIKKVRDRVIKSHMSLDACKELLRVNDLSKVRNIVLLHLSGDNSDPIQFLEEIKATTGKRVFIAKKGLELELNKDLF